VLPRLLHALGGRARRYNLPMVWYFFENCLDWITPRLSSRGVSARRLSNEEFENLVEQLIREKGWRERSRTTRQVVLVAPGRIIGSLTKEPPRLRYKLALREDNHVEVEVFEHIFCRPGQRKVLSQLFAKRKADLLALIDGPQTAASPAAGEPSADV
jgi:hypothetical protein